MYGQVDYMRTKFIISVAIFALALCAASVQAQLTYPSNEDLTGTQEYQQPPAETSGQPVNPEQVATGQPVQGLSKEGPSAGAGATLLGKQVIPGLVGRVAGQVNAISIDSSGAVMVSLSDQASESFGFLLQSGDDLAAHQAILDMLEYAFDGGEEVNIGYGANNEILAVEISI